MALHCKHPESYLVAHRGDRDGGMENTLAAFEYAASAGARYAECDIQFSRDLIPVVLHDNWLKRLCGRPDMKTIRTDLSELTNICRDHYRLLTLLELLEWLQSQPQLTLFVEIKPTILCRLSASGVVKRLSAQMAGIPTHQIILISQSADIIDTCNSKLDFSTGWVAESRRAPESNIDYVFMPSEQAGDIAHWHHQGVQVGLYTVNDMHTAEKLLESGADLIETDYFSRMVSEHG